VNLITINPEILHKFAGNYALRKSANNNMSTLQKHTLYEILENSNRLYSGRPALSFAGQEPYTYNDTYNITWELSYLLHSKGIKKGDRVAVLSQNMPHWGISYFAITSITAITVPILTEFNEREIRKILEHCGASAIIVSKRLAPKLKQALPETLHTAILADDFSIIEINQLQEYGEIKTIQQKEEWKTAIGKGLNNDINVPEENDLAAILYTSGTTGNPKGVMLTHKNLVSNAVNTTHIQELNENDRMLSVLPLAHTYECTIGFILPVMNGASVYYLEKPPTAAVLVPAMQEVKPTMMLTVPLIIEKIFKIQVLPKLTGTPIMKRLYRMPFFRRLLHKMAGKKIYKTFGGNLHFFGIGGAKLAADTEQFLRDAEFPYAIGYGLTETSPLLAGCTPSLTRYRSTGYGLPGQELKIDNPDPETGEGEILAKGPNIMVGYYKDEEQTRAVFTEDGWLKTGDLGAFDEDKFLYIRGRIKNMVVGPSGENIYPEEIEAVINNQSLVLESVVYEMSGKLIARVHLNYEELEKYYNELKETAKNIQVQMSEIVNEKLNEIKQKVNNEVNKFSRLNKIEEQQSPFEKTPTQKIKRYLYHKQEKPV
jgi:long-chain acyl-CoA synthetase